MEKIGKFRKNIQGKAKVLPIISTPRETTVSDWVSLDLKCVYGMFSFCGFIWNVLPSVQWRETSSRSESLATEFNPTDFFYCLEAIYTKKEPFCMLFIAQYVKQLLNV